MKIKKVGRPKGTTKDNNKKMYSFRLSEEELQAVRNVLADMRKKLTILFLMLMLALPVNALTLEGSVSYTEETARQEAFEGVDKIDPSAIFLPRDERYWFDLNATKGGKLIGKSKAMILGIIPHTAFHVYYDDAPDREYLYEKQNGKYKLFAIIDISERNKPYPQRFVKYDNYGHLMSIEFNSGYESFVFDKDGKLIGRWQGNKGQTPDKKVKIKQELTYFEQ